MEIWIIVLQVIQIVLLFVAGLFIKQFLPSYFSEKGKNLATKEDIREITEKVEAVRIQYAGREHRRRIAFEKEFEILSEVWKALFTLRLGTLGLRPIFDLSDPHIPDSEKRMTRLKEFSDSYNRFAEVVMSNEPFYPKNIFASLDKIRQLALIEANEYRFLSNQHTNDYWDRAIKNSEKILKAIEDARDLIRKRYSS